MLQDFLKRCDIFEFVIGVCLVSAFICVASKCLASTIIIMNKSSKVHKIYNNSPTVKEHCRTYYL